MPITRSQQQPLAPNPSPNPANQPPNVPNVTHASGSSQPNSSQLPTPNAQQPLPPPPAHSTRTPQLKFSLQPPPKLDIDMPFVEWLPRIKQQAIAFGWGAMIAQEGADLAAWPQCKVWLS